MAKSLLSKQKQLFIASSLYILDNSNIFLLPKQGFNMPHMKSLTLVAIPPVLSSEVHRKRARLIERLEDQIALVEDPLYLKIKNEFRKVDGQKQLVQKQTLVRPWWIEDEKGQLIFQLKIGRSVAELEKGKTGIAIGPKARLSETIQTIILAIREGEMDNLLLKDQTLARPRTKKAA